MTFVDPNVNWPPWNSSGAPTRGVHPRHRPAPGGQDFLARALCSGQARGLFPLLAHRDAGAVARARPGVGGVGRRSRTAGQPPASWAAVFALVEQLARHERLLLVLDEIPYRAARDASLPSALQNWWDGRGRTLDLMLVLCGSAVQMMEGLLTGAAPLAGCITGRLPVRPLDFRAAADLVGYADPVTALAAYGILGGVPLYLTFFQPARSLRDNILNAIVSPSSRLYVEPQAVFAAAGPSGLRSAQRPGRIRHRSRPAALVGHRRSGRGDDLVAQSRHGTADRRPGPGRARPAGH